MLDTPATVLLLEDDEDTRTLLAEVISDEGVIVLTAASCEEALEIARSAAESIDLVVTDLMMPGPDGSTFVHAIAGDPRLCEVPVLVVSSLELDADERQLVRARAFLKKPVELRTLRETVESLVKRPA